MVTRSSAKRPPGRRTPGHILNGDIPIAGFRRLGHMDRSRRTLHRHQLQHDLPAVLGRGQLGQVVLPVAGGSLTGKSVGARGGISEPLLLLTDSRPQEHGTGLSPHGCGPLPTKAWPCDILRIAAVEGKRRVQGACPLARAWAGERPRKNTMAGAGWRTLPGPGQSLVNPGGDDRGWRVEDSAATGVSDPSYRGAKGRAIRRRAEAMADIPAGRLRCRTMGSALGAGSRRHRECPRGGARRGAGGVGRANVGGMACVVRLAWTVAVRGDCGKRDSAVVRRHLS
jgi:hypothetical protein